VSAFVINSYAFGGGEDPDAAAYLNAVESADTQALEAAVRKAVDDFVKGLKADGLWSAIKASCILAGARTLAGALVPLVGSAPTNVSGNFVSGDYDRKDGLKSDGSTKHLDSNRNNNTDPQNDRHYAVRIHTLHVTGAGTYIGSPTRTTGASGFLRSGAAPANNQFRQGDNNGSNVSGGNVAGFAGASRSSSSAYTARSGGSNFNISATSQSLDSGNILVFKGLDFHSNARLQFYSIGEALDLADLDTRVGNLMTDLDAAI
jgi:hypothetical protein